MAEPVMVVVNHPTALDEPSAAGLSGRKKSGDGRSESGSKSPGSKSPGKTRRWAKGLLFKRTLSDQELDAGQKSEKQSKSKTKKESSDVDNQGEGHLDQSADGRKRLKVHGSAEDENEKQDVKKLQKQNKELAKSTAQLGKQVDTLKHEKDSLAIENSRLKGDMKVMEKDLKRVRFEVERLRSKGQKQSENVGRGGEKTQDLQERVQQLEAELSRKNLEISNLQHSTAAENTSSDMGDANLEKQLQLERDASANLKKENSQLCSQVVGLERDLDKLLKLIDVHKEADRLQSKASEYGEAKSEEDSPFLTPENSPHQQRRNDTTLDMVALQSYLKLAREEKKATEQQRQNLQEELEKVKSQLDQTKDSWRKEKEELMQQVQRRQEELAQTIESSVRVAVQAKEKEWRELRESLELENLQLKRDLEEARGKHQPKLTSSPPATQYTEGEKGSKRHGSEPATSSNATLTSVSAEPERNKKSKSEKEKSSPKRKISREKQRSIENFAAAKAIFQSSSELSPPLPTVRRERCSSENAASRLSPSPGPTNTLQGLSVDNKSQSMTAIGKPPLPPTSLRQHSVAERGSKSPSHAARRRSWIVAERRKSFEASEESSPSPSAQHTRAESSPTMSRMFVYTTSVDENESKSLAREEQKKQERELEVKNRKEAEMKKKEKEEQERQRKRKEEERKKQELEEKKKQEAEKRERLKKEREEQRKREEEEKRERLRKEREEQRKKEEEKRKQEEEKQARLKKEKEEQERQRKREEERRKQEAEKRERLKKEREEQERQRKEEEIRRKRDLEEKRKQEAEERQRREREEQEKKREQERQRLLQEKKKQEQEKQELEKKVREEAVLKRQNKTSDVKDEQERKIKLEEEKRVAEKQAQAAVDPHPKKPKYHSPFGSIAQRRQAFEQGKSTESPMAVLRRNAAPNSKRPKSVDVSSLSAHTSSPPGSPSLQNGGNRLSTIVVKTSVSPISSPQLNQRKEVKIVEVQKSNSPSKPNPPPTASLPPSVPVSEVATVAPQPMHKAATVPTAMNLLPSSTPPNLSKAGNTGGINGSSPGSQRRATAAASAPKSPVAERVTKSVKFSPVVTTTAGAQSIVKPSPPVTVSNQLPATKPNQLGFKAISAPRLSVPGAADIKKAQSLQDIPEHAPVLNTSPRPAPGKMVAGGSPVIPRVTRRPRSERPNTTSLSRADTANLANLISKLQEKDKDKGGSSGSSSKVVQNGVGNGVAPRRPTMGRPVSMYETFTPSKSDVIPRTSSMSSTKPKPHERKLERRATVGFGLDNNSKKSRLLRWCQIITDDYDNIFIKDFSSSFSDGLAFCAILHHFVPDKIPYSSLNPQDKERNFRIAFEVAESEDIPSLLDIEDMVSLPVPDWMSVMTYVSFIYNRFGQNGKKQPFLL